MRDNLLSGESLLFTRLSSFIAFCFQSVHFPLSSRLGCFYCSAFVSVFPIVCLPILLLRINLCVYLSCFLLSYPCRRCRSSLSVLVPRIVTMMHHLDLELILLFKFMYNAHDAHYCICIRIPRFFTRLYP